MGTFSVLKINFLLAKGSRTRGPGAIAPFNYVIGGLASL